MKVLQKVSLIFVIAILAIFITGVMPHNVALAVATNNGATKNSTDVTSIMDSVNTTTISNTTTLTNIGSKILTLIQVLSGIFAVIMIAVLGFNYITETPDVKKEIKSKLLPIIVGILLVFFATSIAKFLVSLFQ